MIYKSISEALEAEELKEAHCPSGFVMELYYDDRDQTFFWHFDSENWGIVSNHCHRIFTASSYEECADLPDLEEYLLKELDHRLWLDNL